MLAVEEDCVRVVLLGELGGRAADAPDAVFTVEAAGRLAACITSLLHMGHVWLRLSQASMHAPW